MYTQNVNDIKVAVIMLDGCILDLNRYRYNYYHRLCKEHNVDISKQDFYSHLGNMYDMYKDFPLANKYKLADLNKRIEDELYEYLKYKGIYPKEELFELLDYFHQKDIKIAVMSTHRTKRAVEYLQLIRVFPHVHYIIGSDTRMKPLPSNEMLKAIATQFEVNYHQMLIISPFLSLNKAAQSLETNILYYKDLVEPQTEEIKSSFKVVSTFFDILNCLLFDSIYDVNMYSSVLGMTDKMNKQELDRVNDHLKDIYQDDPDILNIVEDTYQYHLSQLNDNHTVELKQEEVINEEKPADEEEMLFEVQSEQEDEEVISKENILSLNKQETMELTSVWNKLMLNENQDEEEIDETVNENEEKHYNFFDVFVYILSDIIYSLAISFLILFVGVIFGVLIQSYSVPILSTGFHYYYLLIEMIFSAVFNGLHFIIPFVPLYDTWLASSHMSITGIQFFQIFIFNFIIIFIIKLFIMFIKRDEIFNEED